MTRSEQVCQMAMDCSGWIVQPMFSGVAGLGLRNEGCHDQSGTGTGTGQQRWTKQLGERAIDPDVIVGTPDLDEICPLGGNDFVDAGAGDDEIWLQSGDTVYTGPGDDDVIPNDTGNPDNCSVQTATSGEIHALNCILPFIETTIDVVRIGSRLSPVAFVATDCAFTSLEGAIALAEIEAGGLENLSEDYCLCDPDIYTNGVLRLSDNPDSPPVGP